MQDQLVYIYKIINMINKKIYIGQTINPSSRWSRHKYKGKSEKYVRHPLYIAMKKYGLDNFKFEIISIHDAEEIDSVEIDLIKQYNSTSIEYGYNLDKGGQVNRVISESTRLKMSKAKLGKKLTEETKVKLRGRIPPNKGKPSPQRGNIKVPEKYHTEICALFETLTTREIGKMYNCSMVTILKILRKYHIPIGRSGFNKDKLKYKISKLRLKNEESICEAYLNDEKTSDIAKRFGCDYTSIYNVLKRNNIPTKKSIKHNKESNKDSLKE